MLTSKKIEKMIGVVLAVGTLLSALLVLIGGVSYLITHGSEALQNEWTLGGIRQFSLSLSSIGIIEIGLLVLVGIQLLRVGLLVWFYTVIHDYAFSLISLFILLTLIYSFIWRS